MGFTIPNDVSGGTDEQHTQAAPTTLDFAVIAAALQGDGVLSGCAATPQGSPDMTYAVAAGTVAIGGVTAAVTAANVTVTTANATNPRVDLIVVDNTGAKSVVAGTAAANPVPPAIPANSICLYTVYVAANDTTLTAAELVDKRAVIRQATKKLTANETGATTASLADTSLSFKVSNGVYYRFRFTLNYQTTVTTVGFKVGLTTPTFTRFTAHVIVGGFAADAAAAGFLGVINSSGDSVVATAAAATGVDMPCVVEGVILPSADGTLMLQYAAETTGATVTLMQASAGELTVLA